MHNALGTAKLFARKESNTSRMHAHARWYLILLPARILQSSVTAKLEHMDVRTQR